MERLEPFQLWFLMAAVAYLGYLFGRSSRGGMSYEDRQHRRMQQRQEAERLFSGLQPKIQQDVDALIQQGEIIQAIKVVRENSGAGLKEAKQAVDMRRATMGAV
jgi:hypothetical protein